MNGLSVGLPGRLKSSVTSLEVSPPIERLRDELRAIVDANRLRRASIGLSLLQNGDDVVSGEPLGERNLLLSETLSWHGSRPSFKMQVYKNLAFRVDQETGGTSGRRIFDLYAFEGHTLDSLIDELDREGLVYSSTTRRFTRSKLHYRYYCCGDYNAPEHPRIRLQERALDEQMLCLFDKLRIEDEKTRDWFALVLRDKTRSNQEANKDRITDLHRQLTMLRRQQD